MPERRLEFECLDSRDLCAMVGIGAEGETGVTSSRLIPIEIDDVAGVRAAEVRLRYNPDAWRVEPSAIKAGSAWVNGGAALAKVDSTAGEITVFVFSAEEQPANPGTLIDLEFSPQSSIGDVSPTVELRSVRLNEGSIPAGLNVGREPDDGDYINPRVRAKVAAETRQSLTLPSKSLSVVRETNEMSQLSLSDRHNPEMGPHPLFPRKWLSTLAASIMASDKQVATVEPATQSTVSHWMLLHSSEEQHFRKRAS